MSLTLTILGIPSTKVPVGFATLVSFIIPPMVCYSAAAVLAVTPKTRTIRVALLPIVTLLALRAIVSLDMSLGGESWNTPFVFIMIIFIARTLEWTLAREPLKRYLRPANSPPSVIMDVINLILNLRGHGWNWSHGLYIPRQTHPTNRSAFVTHAFLSSVVHALVMSMFHQAILTLTATGVKAIPGGSESTIFDVSLPSPVRYLRSSIISICTALTIYALAQAYYDLYTVLCIFVFGQDPVQFPPAFDAPWRATSVSEFWGRRWHQWCRQSFLVMGGYPFAFFFGRTGMVFGVFLASAAIHHVALQGTNSKLESWWMFAGFGMMAPGVLAERAFLQITGRRVGGVVGWVWTMTWLLLWGNVIVEGFIRAAMFDHECLINYAPPVAGIGGTSR
ncbi:hypothetical protein JVU11DRAFT_1009 [Chiua virens]|nr:hypothetical protein JVU11DRAFT_1009 [Chiua virens]